MSEDELRVEYLFKAYIMRKCSSEEAVELFDYIGQGKYDKVLSAVMDTYYGQIESGTELYNPDWEKMFSEITEHTEVAENKQRVRFRSLFIRYAGYAAAACVLIFGVAVVMQHIGKRQQPSASAPVEQAAGIVAGSDKAVLTLGDGSTVQLIGSDRRQLKQGGVVVKQQGAAITYTGDNDGSASYNTLSTPRGGQYHLVLSDGTGVWLNAASSIHYPVAFTGKTREVSITGEAYFEIKHDAAHPFVVRTANQVTEDIGTAFDICSYSDEPGIRTTLVEGAVKVNGKLIHPGEQSVLMGNNLSVESVNVEKMIAWKNGLFYFENDDFKSMMKAIGRWYDIKVEYKGGEPLHRFEGQIPRNYNLSDVLDVLKASGINFTFKDKTLTVKP